MALKTLEELEESITLSFVVVELSVSTVVEIKLPASELKFVLLTAFEAFEIFDFCWSYLNTLVVDVVVDGDWVFDDIVSVLPSFLPANSYMSPNIPAKVLRKFFMVSSASSTTEFWDWGAERVAPVLELVDVCEAELNVKIENNLLFSSHEINKNKWNVTLRIATPYTA